MFNKLRIKITYDSYALPVPFSKTINFIEWFGNTHFNLTYTEKSITDKKTPYIYKFSSENVTKKSTLNIKVFVFFFYISASLKHFFNTVY
jgi:hypothetical protein